MPGSGKEEFVKVAEREGFSVVRMGDVVRIEARRRGLEPSDENVGRMASSEREKHGLGIWAERTVPVISGDKILIDGIRGDSEIEVFKNTFGDDLTVIGVAASPEVRFERLKCRNRDDAPSTWEEFQERDRRELSWGLDKALALCNHMISNEGTLEEFHEKVKNLLQYIK